MSAKQSEPPPPPAAAAVTAPKEEEKPRRTRKSRVDPKAEGGVEAPPPPPNQAQVMGSFSYPIGLMSKEAKKAERKAVREGTQAPKTVIVTETRYSRMTSRVAAEPAFKANKANFYRMHEFVDRPYRNLGESALSVRETLRRRGVGLLDDLKKNTSHLADRNSAGVGSASACARAPLGC